MSKKDEMPLLDHLAELRKRLTVMVAANVITAMLLFNEADRMMQYLLAINPGMQLVYISPSELLIVYIQLSFIAALILCSPINIYEVWAFTEKGLYKHEKIYVLVSLFFGLFCFIGGVLFCYFIVLPITLQFFDRIAITEISAMISIKSYTGFVNVMLVSFGAVFEMPVLVFLFTKLEFIKPAFLKAHRGILIVAIFVFAAIITPPDVVSQTMLAIPMILLLQISIYISVLVDKSNRKQHAREEQESRNV